MLTVTYSTLYEFIQTNSNSDLRKKFQFKGNITNPDRYQYKVDIINVHTYQTVAFEHVRLTNVVTGEV